LVNNVFQGICGQLSHKAIRIAFHDAIGFSTTANFGNGADGSIIKFPEERQYTSNLGFDGIVGKLKPVADQFNVSYGDIIAFSSSVALTMCPGAPRVKTFVGRPDATTPAPDFTIPSAFQPVEGILARMADAGFSPDEVVALLASHSVAAQDRVDTTVPGSPLDSTPDRFDSQIYLETLLKGTAYPGKGPHFGEVKSPLPGELRLQSDAAIARHAKTACTWQGFVGNQKLMEIKFADAMLKLSLLGQPVNDLVDCTEALPTPATLSRGTLYPAGKSFADVEQSCSTQPFPKLKTVPGPSTTVARVPPQN
jgi:hypothetical protein